MSDDRQQRRGLEGVGEELGGMAGRVAGRVGDAAVSATGAIFDSMASMLGAWWSGEEARQAAASFGDSEERACRRHFESSSTRAGSDARDYESTRPLYQFGFVAGQHPSYRGRSFDEVEPELRNAWESTPRRSGSWNEVRDYVGFSYRNRPGSSSESHGL